MAKNVTVDVGFLLNMQAAMAAMGMDTSELDAKIVSAGKSANEAKAESAAKRVNEAATAEDLAEVALYAEETAAAIAIRDARAAVVAATKAEMDALKVRLEAEKEALEEAAEAINKSKGSVVGLRVAQRVLGDEYMKYRWGVTGDAKSPFKATIPSAPKAPKPEQAAGAPKPDGRAKHQYNVRFPSGKTLEKVDHKTFLAELQKEYGQKWESVSFARSLKGAAGGNTLAEWSRGNKDLQGGNNFPVGRELKDGAGQIFAIVTHL